MRMPEEAPRRSATPLRPTDFLRLPKRSLPEEIVNDVDDEPRVDVHQQRVVIITHPAIGAICRRQVIHPRVVEPVSRPVIIRSEAVTGGEATITPAVRIIVAAELENRTMTVTIARPVISIVPAPIPRPVATTVAVAVPIPVIVVALADRAIVVDR